MEESLTQSPAQSPSQRSAIQGAPDLDAGMLTLSEEERLNQAAKDPYPWIMSRNIDLIFVCGGLFWALYLVLAATGFKVDLFGGPTAFIFAAISILGVHAFGDGHQIATMYRVYQSAPTRKVLGAKVAIVGLIALATGMSTLLWHETSQFWVKLVLAWGIQHQLAQSYGIALVYCYKRKYYMNQHEKGVMHFMVQSAMVYLILRMFAFDAFGNYTINHVDYAFERLVPAWLSHTALGVTLASLAYFAYLVYAKAKRDKQMFPIPGLMVLMTLIVMPFVAQERFVLVWVAFSTTFFHTTQYLVVTSAYYFKERGLPADVSYHQISSMLKRPVAWGYFGLLFGIGFTMAYLLPNWMIQYGQVEQAYAFASVYVFVNIHHFITDMYIWKLRDPYVQKLLVA